MSLLASRPKECLAAAMIKETSMAADLPTSDIDINREVLAELDRIRAAKK